MVHEPRYLQMFEVIMEVARAESAVPRFGMISDLKSLEEFTQDPQAEGLQSNDTRIGSCCLVESITDTVGGGLLVNYNCAGRFILCDVKRTVPFHVAQVVWVTDYPPDMPGSSSGASRDRLEREVWQALNAVATLTAKLESAAKQSEVPSLRSLSEDWLPAAVRQFAPLLYSTVPTLHQTDIATWRRSSLSGSRCESLTSVQSSDEERNPYWCAREKLVKPLRQEAFSFAAASIVEAGAQERSALLQTRDTSTRLSWVLDAVGPHLARLQAQNSLLEAMGSTQ